jgi:hypothetical protein
MKTHLCSAIFFFSKSLHLWNNVEKYCRAGQAVDIKMQRNCIVYLIPKVANTHLDYVILIAFPLQ